MSTTNGVGRYVPAMPQFRCPTCRSPLDGTTTGMRCAQGHSFDRAREGYVNLLPGGRLAGRSAGDDETMVRSRRQVFDAGLYDPVLDAVAAAVATDAPADVLDIGCGEGSYGRAIAARCGAQVWGIDVSKPAVKVAARRHREGRYAVASAYALPFADHEFDAVTNVFSPRDFAEMFRVLRPGAPAFVVTPGPHHLVEIKRALYDSPRDHADDDESSPAERETSIRFSLALPDEHLRLCLLQMTPYWWSATEPRRQAVVAGVDVVTIDMRLRVHRCP